MASFLFLFCILLGQAEELPVVAWQGRTMGSPYTVKIVGSVWITCKRKRLRRRWSSVLREVNRQMSHYQPDSELSQFNRAPANSPSRSHPSSRGSSGSRWKCTADRTARLTPRCPGHQSLGFRRERPTNRAVPPEAELKAAMKKTGCQHLSVTAHDEFVKDIPELTINLSAVAKGFGVDEMVRVLQRQGLDQHLCLDRGRSAGAGSQPARQQTGRSASPRPSPTGAKMIRWRPWPLVQPGDLHLGGLPEVFHRSAGPASVPYHRSHGPVGPCSTMSAVSPLSLRTA